MPDLLEEVREIRQKLSMLEVLLEVEGGKRTAEWFKDDPERRAAVERLEKTGRLERTAPPAHFRLTEAGARLLVNVRKKTSNGGRIDWSKVRDADFPSL